MEQEVRQMVASLMSEVRRGTLIMLVLSRLNTAQYGYSIVKSLSDSEIPIEANTLYPLMRRLEAQNLLKSEWETSSSKPRKYYELTDFGRAVLQMAQEQWEIFYKTVNKLMEEQ